MLANFEALVGVPSCTWTYLEVGHSKGKTVVHSAYDFYLWVSHVSTTVYLIRLCRCDRKKELISQIKPSSVKNTYISVHAVCSLQPGEVTVKTTSCFYGGSFRPFRFFALFKGEKQTLYFAFSRLYPTRKSAKCAGEKPWY